MTETDETFDLKFNYNHQDYVCSFKEESDSRYCSIGNLL